MKYSRDEIFKFIGNLRTIVGGSEIVGSCMFITDTINNYLVTASHVAKDCDNTTSIVISDDSSKAHIIKLNSLSKDLMWRSHDIADISILKIDSNTEILKGRFFSTNFIYFNKSPPSRDIELTSIGFPHGLGVHGLFSPLSFRSYNASNFIDLPRADNKIISTFFVLENPSVGGYSGCPVFDLGLFQRGQMQISAGSTICYGIMHGTTIDETGGKMALVTPSFYLLDLLTDFTNEYFRINELLNTSHNLFFSLLEKETGNTRPEFYYNDDDKTLFITLNNKNIYLHKNMYLLYKNMLYLYTIKDKFFIEVKKINIEEVIQNCNKINELLSEMS